MREFFGAEDRARTGHLDLGKVALYQMSYFRRLCVRSFILKINLAICFSDGKNKD